MRLRNHLFCIGFIFVLFMQVILPSITVFAEENSTVSTIGSIEITVKKESEIQAILTQAIVEWKEHRLLVTGQSGSVEIPTDYVRFDVQGSINRYEAASKAPWYMPWKRNEIVHIPLMVEPTEELSSLLRENPFFHVEETTARIIEQASGLKTTEVEAFEMTMTKEHMDRTAFEIQPIPKSPASLSALVAMLDGVVLSKGETFSFLERTEESVNTTNIEARRFFASTLYSVVLQADTTILERHSQNKIPNYLQAGIEVDVSNRLQKDFVFKNNSRTPMLFHAEIEDEHLLIELYTVKDAKKMTYSVIETKIEPRTIYRLSSKLKGNEQRLVQDGEDGSRVTVYRAHAQGGFDGEEEISKDFYAPTHKIIEIAGASERNPSPNDGRENSNENNSNSSEVTDNKDRNNNGKDKNDSDHKDRPNDEGRPAPNDPKQDGNDGENNGDEVIYDKGGNVIYDPKA